jgi:hypothetical protein
MRVLTRRAPCHTSCHAPRHRVTEKATFPNYTYVGLPPLGFEPGSQDEQSEVVPTQPQPEPIAKSRSRFARFTSLGNVEMASVSKSSRIVAAFDLQFEFHRVCRRKVTLPFVNRPSHFSEEGRVCLLHANTIGSPLYSGRSSTTSASCGARRWPQTVPAGG